MADKLGIFKPIIKGHQRDGKLMKKISFCSTWNYLYFSHLKTFSPFILQQTRRKQKFFFVFFSPKGIIDVTDPAFGSGDKDDKGDNI